MFRKLMLAITGATRVLGVLPVPAAANGGATVVCLNGLPGTKVDICEGNKELRSNIRFGGVRKIAGLAAACSARPRQQCEAPRTFRPPPMHRQETTDVSCASTPTSAHGTGTNAAHGVRMGLSTPRPIWRCFMGDKGPGSKSGAKKPKGGSKPGDKKKR